MMSTTAGYTLSILFALSASFGFAESVLDEKRILIINSYDPAFPTTERRLEGFRSALKNENVIIDVEFMDSKRHFDPQITQLYLALLERKLASRQQYDVVIASDDNALDLLLKHGHRLETGVPIVFNGLNNMITAEAMTQHPGVTGITEDVSIRENLALIQSLDSNRSNLHVIVDSTPSGQADLDRVMRVSSEFPKLSIRKLELAQLSWDQFKATLKQLGPRDSILLLSAFRDESGKALSFKESLEVIKTHAHAPIYHLWEHGLGDGILGGYLINQYEQGRLAGSMAIQLIQGASIQDLPVIMESTTTPMFDYRQLQRFDIPMDRLPSGSQVLFKPKSVWVTHRNQLAGAAVVITGLFLLALYLMRLSVQRHKLMEAHARKSAFLNSLMNTIPDLIWLKSLDGVYLACNRRFEQLYGTSEGNILGKTDFDFVNEELATFFRKHDMQAMERGEPTRNEERLVFKSDGHEELLETVKTPLTNEGGEVIGILGISRDITDRASAEEKIRTLLQAIEQSPVSVMICNKNSVIEYVNKAFTETTGYSESEALGKNPRFLQSGRTPASNYQDMWDALNAGKSWEGELHNRKKSGDFFWEYAHMSPILSEDGSVSGYLSVKEDITIKRQQEERILFQAQFDSLTHLPNRALSLNRLERMIKRAERHHLVIAVLYIDLDDFKKVNDTLGHVVGDQLLVQLADRLQSVTRDEDSVGRLGGDEFLVLIDGLADGVEAGHIAAGLIKSLEAPVVIDDRELLISASIGIALYPQDGDEQGDLLRKADLAMYSAKNSGRSNHAFYTAELNDKIERRFLIEQQMSNAIERDEFYLTYQPKIEMSSNRLMGFEALLRWKNDVLGEVSPFEFIPIAEQSGAILSIGEFVIDTAFRQLKHINQGSGPLIQMAINLSPRQFRNENLGQTIISHMHKFHLNPAEVECEITEGLFIDDHPGIQKALGELHQAGINLAMDDFGTGYSSLSYLRHYPFSTLKVDKEFIQGITDDPADRELVQAAISMAHSLGMTVVAEGVETSEQKDALIDMRCDIGQGYFYAKPIHESDLEAYIASMTPASEKVSIQ